MKMKLFAMAFVAIAIIGMASKWAQAADGWYGFYSVNEVVVHGGGYLIETDSPLADCGAQGRFWIPASTPLAKEMYALALSAYLTGKKIGIYVDAGQGCVVWGMVSTLIKIRD